MIEVQVTNRREPAERIVEMILEPVSATPLPAWSPGAHIDVEVTTAEGGPVLRQYSLCGHPDDSRWRIVVLDVPDSRGGSKALRSDIAAGQRVRVSEPRNNFPLHDDGSPAVLIAGGIGVTPIVPMAWALHEQHTPFRMHYQFRSQASAALFGELRDAPFAGRVSFGSDEDSDPVAAIRRTLEDVDPHAHLYVCGPAGFIEAAEVAAAAGGMSAHHIHRELFSALQSAAESENDAAFELVLSDSGFSVQVPPGQTAAQALEAAGIELPLSCEQGLCGSCLTRVLEGEPDHRDAFLLPEERKRGDYFTPCCSRAKSDRLVVEL